jgi:hypothetical protein
VTTGNNKFSRDKRRDPAGYLHPTPYTLLNTFNKHYSLTPKLQTPNPNPYNVTAGMIPAGYQFGACFDDRINLSAAGQMLGTSMNPMQGQIIEQIMGQVEG